MSAIGRRGFATLTLLAAAGVACRTKGESGSGAEDSIGPLLAPSELAARIADVEAGKIAVLYVGPAGLFGRGHVPGAKMMASVDSDDGRRALSEALARIPTETEVVVYCGCCPVRSCPNVRPASAAVRALKRPNARVLDLPTRFSTDWADKGYPVARG